ncbi:MAG: hemolysin III family protein [Clostridia bacterium]|nr:hemolysin III family protein [Clostridia bacterium]
MSKIREPGSAITHLIGALLSALAAFPLISRANTVPGFVNVISMSIFIASMFLLYTASTTYHSLSLSAAVVKVFRKIDHMMIFVLIAGSYTPICLIVLKGKTGIIMLSVIWSLALIGILIKAFWITCPKWFSSVIYIGMGWTCVFAFRPLMNLLPSQAMLWLFAGGVLYTVGGVIYALKLQIFNQKHSAFGSHEIFHLFVLAGSLCHFVFMYHYVAVM